MVRIRGAGSWTEARAADAAGDVGRGGGKVAMKALPGTISHVGYALFAVAVASASGHLALAQVKGPGTSAASVTIYRHGRIYTNDPRSPWAEAMLVRGEEIIAVGDDDEVAGLADKGAQGIDLEKHFVMPGFNEPHVQIGGAGGAWLPYRAYRMPTVGD